MARLMRAQRPDLSFILLNRVAAQMRHVPTRPGFLPVLGDMHAIPLAAGSVDGVLFSWALCHADHPAALAEAARVVKPGEFLFLYELIRTRGDNALFEQHLHARAYPVAELLGMCEAAGFALELFLAPAADGAQMRALFAHDPALHDAIFSDLRPAVWKLVRKPAAPSAMEGPTP
ncbi:MAG: class I SAM-dependent methyltransferase [Pseudomonas sp.]|uniref:methyltransferase domain-containing protein n=1 Tax=Pseudomonas sp. TaxID=306 RepID=UPI0012266233|nr:methyltransferase domain-containing protein [Pseudomonas sp.]RZI72375.1 MAG: class I SAM-dependent methyltransferase [Pseudomonas sp.]